MKRHLNLLVVIVIVAGAYTGGAQAQTGAQKVVANIPFAFNVGNTSLPAGKYTITVLNSTSDRKILQIRNRNGRSSAMILTTAVTANASEDAKLVFQRYADRYFFAQAQMAGDSTTFAAVKSSAERAQQQAVASARKQTQIVILAE